MADEKRTIGTPALDTQMLTDYLREQAKGGEGTFISYEQLGHVVHRVIDGADGNLGSARRAVEREDGVVWGCVRGEGLKYLTPAETVAESHSGLGTIRRKSLKIVKRLAVADYTRLDEGDRLRHNTTAAIAHAIHQATKSSSVKRIAGQVSEAGKVLPVNETLQVLMK